MYMLDSVISEPLVVKNILLTDLDLEIKGKREIAESQWAAS